MNGIYIDAERPLILFIKKQKVKSGQFRIKASLSEVYDGEDYMAQPALLRISGRPSEAMITLEADSLTIQNISENDMMSPKIYDFNLFQEGAGNIVYVRPSDNEKSFIVPIGGTVMGDYSNANLYSGFNIVYVNFL